MTRINTNVLSLSARNNLNTSQMSLQTALTRLSTGLRINTGADDPAGLIASQSLKATITSTQSAISNSQNANQMIATADSALSQVGSLLNSIQGLVTQSANTGAMSADQIAANQLQVDSSLNAIDRISQTTSYQGRNLLDGSLDFITQAGTNFTSSTVKDLQINQATLGSSGQLAVDVNVTTAATQAKLTDAAGAYNNATATLDFGMGYNLAANNGGAAVDIQVSNSSVTSMNVVVNYSDLGANHTANATYSAGTLTVTLNSNNASGGNSTAADIAAAIAGNNAAANVVTAYVTGSGSFSNNSTVDAHNSTAFVNSNLTVTALTTGPSYNNLKVQFATSATVGAAPTAAYDSTANTLTVTVNNASGHTATTLAAIQSAINNVTVSGSQAFAATAGNATNARADIFAGSTQDTGQNASTALTGGGILTDSLTLQVNGDQGAQVFNFDNGTTIAQVASAINLVSDSTGVTATNNNGTLELKSTDYGSAAAVQVKVIAEGNNGTFGTGLNNVTRTTGTDVQATVNGFKAQSTGNQLSIDTSTLSMSMTVSAGTTGDIGFTITGGGALFQLGADVVSNQQARLGIGSVNTASLGGSDGKLYQLGDGGTASLSKDPTTAGKIVNEAINKVSALRGRLGAFQSTTLDSNIATLNDAVTNLSTAQSNITDADFATETANLTRAQILVQSGTQVLSIANQNPQSVLKLLQGA